MTRISLLMLGLVMAGAANAAPTLWERDPQQITEGLEQRSSAAVRGWAIEPSTTLITQKAGQMVVSLPDQTELLVERRRIFSQSDHSTSWAGVGPKGAEVLMTVRDGWMGGLIHTDEHNWEIRPDAEYGTVLLELDTTAFPECSGGFEPPADAREDSHALSRLSRQPSSFEPPPGSSDGNAADNDETVIMDLLALYTPAARQALGGTAQIEAHAEAAIANANQSFENSRVNAQFRIAGIEQIRYGESDSCGTDLGWVRNSSTVQQLRDQYGADMVGMLVQASYCGCGYVMRTPDPGFASNAFQVTATQCAVGNLTYAHEHGHNVGMEHDPANGPEPGTASYPWSFGHFVSGEFRTVMSYPCSGGCPRRMYFSTPNARYNGHPTGIAEQRDNARTASLTSPIVAGFRDPIEPPRIKLETDLLEVSVAIHDPSAVTDLEIGNVGGRSLEWSIEMNSTDCRLPDWVSVSFTSGTIGPGEQQSLEILFDGSDLVPDTYLATVCIDSNDPDQPVTDLTAELQVLPIDILHERFEAPGD